MKILIVNFEYPPLGGGGGVATKQLAEALAGRHEVHVITTWYQGLKTDEVEDGINVHRIRVIGRGSLPTASLVSMISFVPTALLKGWRLCREIKFDVINAQFVVPSGVPASILSRWMRIPFVLSFIGGDLYDPTKGVSPHKHWWLRVIIQLVARQAKVCTAISKDTKRRAQEIHGVKKHIVVTHLGLEPSQVVQKSRADLGLPEQVPLFVSVGRLIPRKGYEMLLKVWREIAQAHLVIVGSGPLRERLEQMIRKFGLEKRVHLKGYLEEEQKQQVLRVANAYVSASEHEGFGIVYLEAMEAGLPIVTTDVGGQRDFLNEEENALLVPVGNEKKMEEAVERLLLDGKLRERLGDNNRGKVKEFYLEKTARKFEAVLIEAAEGYEGSN